MAALGDDCYFFCTSTCAKGAACPFRHVESAKTCRIICQHWQMGVCLRPMCKFRHSDFPLQLDTTDVPCYWESLPTGCVKRNCFYKHLKQRPFDDVAPAATVSVPVDASSAGITSSRNDVSTPQTFVQPVTPVVTPIIIQNLAESEESNSSPMKRPPEVTQEQKVQTIPKVPELEDSKNSKVDEDQPSQPEKQQTVEKKIKKVTPAVKKVKQPKAGQKAEKKVVGKNTGQIKAKPNKSDKQPQKSVKSRLGKAASPEPVIQSSSESSDSESDSESDPSDDSIENIKVMSMEEIFRQKALDSMLKKRATERKPSADKKLSSAAGKKLSSTAGKKLSSTAGKKTSFIQQKPTPVAKNIKKQAATVKRVKHIPAPVESSSSSSEEDSSEEEDTPMQPSEKSSTSSSNTSSASSSSESEEDTAEESDEPDVRRVVVDRKTEKAARKKAKESFLKKQKLSAANFQNNRKKEQTDSRVTARKHHMPLSTLNKDNNRGKQQNRHHVDYDSDDIVSSRVTEPLKLNVRDRLGKSATLHRASSGAHLLSRHEKFGSTLASSKAVDLKRRHPHILSPQKSTSSSSGDDSDSLADVKVKTLEEIRSEKMRTQPAEDSKRNVTSQVREKVFSEAHRPLPVKQRLGKLPNEKQDSDVDNTKSRQVVLVNDTGSKSDDSSSLKTLEEQKRAKKRPWRSQKRNIELSSAETISGDGERTAVIASPDAKDDYASELKSYKKGQDVEESLFERLKRKALMKKLESSRLLKQPADGGDADSKTQKNVETLDDGSADIKTHKHKHGHKHHRRVKIERQIYMPPGMKNTVPEPLQTPEPAPPKIDPATATRVSPLKRGPHPMAAAWAAGLSLSSKGAVARRPEPTPTLNSGNPLAVTRSTVIAPFSTGVTARRPEPTPPVVNSGIVGRFGVVNRPAIKETAKPKETVLSIETSQPSVDSSGVTIKSFSEIMAEKRKRRLEMLAQKSGSTTNSTSSISSSALSSSSAPVSVTSISSESNSASSKQVDVGTRVPFSPIVFESDTSSTSTIKNASQVLRVTAQPTKATTQKVSSAVPVFSTPSTLSSQPHSATVTSDKVKLKSVNNSKNNVDKNKKPKKLFTKRNSKEQIDLIGSVAPEDSSNNIPPSHPCAVASQETSSQQTLSNSKAPAAQFAGLQAQPKSSADKFSTNIDTSSAVKTSATSTRKQSIPAPAVDSESSKKKARLSIMEDEFNFFEDEDLDMDDGIIPEDIEPIDNLLQDIDDLLS